MAFGVSEFQAVICFREGSVKALNSSSFFYIHDETTRRTASLSSDSIGLSSYSERFWNHFFLPRR